MNLCPCCSGSEFQDCCKPYHDGVEAPTPLTLMRSRYSAYARNLPLYIQKTTHPQSPHFEKNQKKWEASISNFCSTNEFIRLEILALDQDWVHFIAHLKDGSKEIQLNEKSYFKKIDSKWRYFLGLFPNSSSTN